MKHTRCILSIVNFFMTRFQVAGSNPKGHRDLHLLQRYTSEQAVNGRNMALLY